MTQDHNSEFDTQIFSLKAHRHTHTHTQTHRHTHRQVYLSEGQITLLQSGFYVWIVIICNCLVSVFLTTEILSHFRKDGGHKWSKRHQIAINHFVICYCNNIAD